MYYYNGAYFYSYLETSAIRSQDSIQNYENQTTDSDSVYPITFGQT